MLAGIPKNSTKSSTTSLGLKKIIPCPQVTPGEIAQGFAEYFVEKIDKIRDKFECVPLYSPPVENVPRFSKFAPLTETETRRLVSSLQNKSCDIDPVPAKVFQLLQDELIPIYTRIINLSLGQGEFTQD